MDSHSRDILTGAFLAFSVGVTGTAGLLTSPDTHKPIITKHAALAIMACNELKLESESVQTEYNNSTNTYEIIAQCSNGVKIHLTVPRNKIAAKEA